MRLVDANILIYAFDSSSVHHDVCKNWLDSKINDLPKIGLPWNSLLAFVRIVSNPRIYQNPVSIAAAWKQVVRWTDQESVTIPTPTDEHALYLDRLTGSTSMNPNDVPDAHLAALSLEHGLVLCSTDRGFHRFEGLRIENPLQH